MTKFIRPFTLSVIFMLILASCGFGGSTPTEAPILPIQQPPTILQAATIELNVTADTTVPFTVVGNIIKYNFSVKNIGAAPVPGPVTWTGAAPTCPDINTLGNKDTSLNPNDPTETLLCTFTYSITQADLDKGNVTLVTTATLNGINSNTSTTNVSVGAPKVLTLTMLANPIAYSKVGDVITFKYVIKNSGTGNLGPDQFKVSPSITGGTPVNCPEGVNSLAPNATLTCDIPYTITDVNLTANTLANQATASGGGAGPSQPASITITKGAVPISPANSTCNPPVCSHTVDDGEWLWQIARCYGVDPLKLAADNKATIPNPAQIKKGMVLTINNPGGYSKYYGPQNCISYVDHTLQTGDTWNTIAQKYTVDPTVLQMANPNASLTATGSVIKLRIPNYSIGTVTPPSTQAKALTLTLTANPLTYDAVGQVITFAYIIKNSGTANLGPAQFTVSPSLTGSTPINCGDANTSLSPNATVPCNIPYTITDINMTAGSVSNQATASGGGAGPSPAVSVVINKGVKALTLTMSVNPITYNAAGQVITYSYTIKNSGNVNLGPAQFTVNPSITGATPINCPEGNSSLAPGATISCNIPYTITDINLTASSLANQATASGGGAGPSQPASVTINKQ